MWTSVLLSFVVLVVWISSPALAEEGEVIWHDLYQQGSVAGKLLASKDLCVRYSSITEFHIDFLYGGSQTGIYCDWVYHPIVEVVPTNVDGLKITNTVQTSTMEGEGELPEVHIESQYVKVSQTSKLDIYAKAGFTPAIFPGGPDVTKWETASNHTFSFEGYMVYDNFTFPALAPTAEDIPVKSGGFKFGHNIINWPFTAAALVNGYLEQNVTVTFYPPQLIIPPSASDPHHVYINHTDGIQTWKLSLEDGAYTDGSYLPISLTTEYNPDLGILNMVFQYQPGLDIFYDPSIQALIDIPDVVGDGVFVPAETPVRVLWIATGLLVVIGILVATLYAVRRVASPLVTDSQELLN
eukprot:TRINITY_DN14139_c0_g1_i1.p1 TRINITY_DN14139_c0_g1~~TRINITY_DN14139_c0_g1_i1.p1  ORF type:complete len:368 (+),score=32.55 TRINITY_DN14139_c0_g1_i1:47-1105(+)